MKIIFAFHGGKNQVNMVWHELQTLVANTECCDEFIWNLTDTSIWFSFMSMEIMPRELKKYVEQFKQLSNTLFDYAKFGSAEMYKTNGELIFRLEKP